MNRYVFRFTKQGYMRFISHLDLARLFKRCLKRIGVELAYSEGYNPHEKINIVQPLSLGFETSGDYFEMETVKPYDPEGLRTDMNSVLPEGLSFDLALEFPKENKNLSARVEWASYLIVIPSCKAENLPIDAFLAQERILISKRDKKTKSDVFKDVKDMIYSFVVRDEEEGAAIDCVLKCASNVTLNPMNLTAAFLAFAGLDVPKETIRVKRTGMYYAEEGRLVPLSELPANKAELSGVPR